MRRIFRALLVVFMVLCFSRQGLAYKINHYREEPGIRIEASAKKVGLIPIASAQMIAARQIGKSNVVFSDIELYSMGSTRSSDFRPVYKLECVSGGRGYYVEVDAVTGIVLTFR